MRVAVLAVRVGVGVAAVMMVALPRFNGSRSAQASEMPMRTSMRMSVDIAPPVPMDDARRRIAHSGHTVATLHGGARSSTDRGSRRRGPHRFGTVTRCWRKGARDFRNMSLGNRGRLEPAHKRRKNGMNKGIEGATGRNRTSARGLGNR